MAAEKMNINEDYMNGYVAGKAAAKEEIERLEEKLGRAMAECTDLRERYDMEYLKAGDVVETSEGYTAVLISEDEDASWNMLYADGKGDNMTKRSFRKTGAYIELEETTVTELWQRLRRLEYQDTDW
jgi:hypothetical protein